MIVYMYDVDDVLVILYMMCWCESIFALVSKSWLEMYTVITVYGAV